MHIDPDTRLTRQQLAEALSEQGFPTKPSTLATKASRGGGPPYKLYGKRPIYTWETSLDWAKSRLSPPRANSSEHGVESVGARRPGSSNRCQTLGGVERSRPRSNRRCTPAGPFCLFTLFHERRRSCDSLDLSVHIARIKGAQVMGISITSSALLDGRPRRSRGCGLQHRRGVAVQQPGNLTPRLGGAGRLPDREDIGHSPRCAAPMSPDLLADGTHSKAVEGLRHDR